MDDITASQFITSLVKNVQALCNGYIEFSTSVEIVGHIHLTVDHKTKLDYVLTEEVSKTVHDDATLFSSYSYHSKPPPGLICEKPAENPAGMSTSTSALTSVVTSTTTSNSSTSRHRRKSPQVPRVDDSACFSFTSVPLVMPLAQIDGASLGTDSPGVPHDSDPDSVPDIKKSPQSSAGYMPDRQQRRRKKSSENHMFPIKRSRSCDTDSNSAQPSPVSVEVLQIKEEPEDDTSFIFGDATAQGVTGQDTQQTPDFSNVVMEPVETTFVAGDDGSQLQYKPFPVMLHAIPDTPLSSVPLLASNSQITVSQPGLPLSSVHMPALNSKMTAVSRTELPLSSVPMPAQNSQITAVSLPGLPSSSVALPAPKVEITTVSLPGPSTSNQPVPSASSEVKASSMKGTCRTQMVQTTYKVHKPLKCTTAGRKATARTAQKKKTKVTARKAVKALKNVPSRNDPPSHNNQSNYLQYTFEDMNEAIELIHGGMSVMEAALKFGIPRATLFNRSRAGCKTHSGRCSEVFLKTHIGTDFTKKRMKSPYTPATMEKAIEAIHSGMPVIDAAILYSIPRASLFIRSGRGCPSHTGRCSTVATNGKLRRTKVSRYQYQQLMEKKSLIDPDKLVQQYPKEMSKSPETATSGLLNQVLKGCSPKMKLTKRSDVESSVGQPSSEFNIPEALCPRVKLVKIEAVESSQPEPNIEDVAENVTVEQPSSDLNVETVSKPVFETLAGTVFVQIKTSDDH